jgi:hypothetical protein
VNLVRKTALFFILLLVAATLVPFSSPNVSGIKTSPVVASSSATQVLAPTLRNFAVLSHPNPATYASNTPRSSDPSASISHYAPFSTPNVQTSSSSSSSRRFGFWVGEGEIFSTLRWTPQEFASNYFETSPYPAALLFASGGGYWFPQESAWLSQLLSITDTMNVKVVLLCFVNLSGHTINGRPDQTSTFTTFMNSLKGHPSLYGAEYENEYFGNTIQEVSAFRSIVNGAGYTNILNPNSNTVSAFPNDPILDYSEYPYFGVSMPSSLAYGTGAIGIGYGETGAPPSGGPNPLWTQQRITSIVDNSPIAQFTFIYPEMGGAGQPFANLWDWQTLRNWIWSDPNYQANYVLSISGGSPPPPPPPPRPPPPPPPSGGVSINLNPSNPSVNSWTRLTISGAPQSIAIKIVVTNMNTHSIVAILFPGTVSHTGSLSFMFQFRASFLGSNVLSIYSLSSSGAAPIASIPFTAS